MSMHREEAWRCEALWLPFGDAFVFALIAMSLAIFLPACCIGQTNIELRDLSQITTKVQNVSLDAIQLENGQLIYWDRVRSGRVGDPFQESFNEFLIKRGRPLFQLRHRLNLGDWESLAPGCETMYQELGDASKESARNDFLVCLATMYGRLGQVNHLDAVQPFLKACDIRRRFQFENPVNADVDLKDIEIEMGLSKKILPLFFDSAAAKKWLSISTDDSKAKSEGKSIYEVAIALCAKDLDLSNRLINTLQAKHEPWKKLFENQLGLAKEDLDVATARRIISNLETMLQHDDLITEQRLIGQFLVATALNQTQSEADSAVLKYCEVAALSQKRHPRLAAASLFEAMTIVEEIAAAQTGQNRARMAGIFQREADIFKRELLGRYANTYHGRLVQRVEHR